MASAPSSKFLIVLPAEAKRHVEGHVKMYEDKGLLRLVEGGAEGIGQIAQERFELEQGTHTTMTRAEVVENVKKTLEDPTGGGVPRKFIDNANSSSASSSSSSGAYYVGIVEPVVHYTMGGLTVSSGSEVLRGGTEGEVMQGLYAVGEVMGGVHGDNSLGGSSLLDCVVFGLGAADGIVKRGEGGDYNSREVEVEVEVEVEMGGGINSMISQITMVDLPEMTELYKTDTNAPPDSDSDSNSRPPPPPRSLPAKQIAVINGRTFDLTAFIPLHPGGPILLSTPNEDLTSRFTNAHGADSFDLLDRASIVELKGYDERTGEGKEVEREKKFYEEYGGEGGSWREFIGRRSWFVLHR